MAYSIRVNGKVYEADVDADTPLLWVLRDVIGLTGTKYGCGIAYCGACTVHVEGKARRSCVTPVSSLGDVEVRTIEALHETVIGKALQTAWKDLDVVQCGYCQPGQLMSASGLLTENPRPSDSEIDAAMEGNICRCGTYGRIRAGISHASKMIGDREEREDSGAST